MDAIGICMHKILRIIYGMLKNNTAFDPQIDDKNRKRIIKSQNSIPKKDKSRRFQDYDADAPISCKQNKKRMEREQSQIIKNTERGISELVPLGSILTAMFNKW